MDDPQLVRDGSGEVSWFSERLRSFHAWIDVGAIMPDGFERNARILHPAYSESPGSQGFVRWSRVAASTGETLTPTSFFGDIALRDDGTRWPGLGPRVELPDEVCRPLVPILEAATGTPERCWFCVWYGWDASNVEDEPDTLVEITPAITGSGRRYYLYRGHVGSVLRLRPPGFGWPNWWWPDDRSWFVSTEIDAWSTYVGGSEALIERLLSSEQLEVMPATLDDAFDGTHPGQRRWPGDESAPSTMT